MKRRLTPLPWIDEVQAIIEKLCFSCDARRCWIEQFLRKRKQFLHGSSLFRDFVSRRSPLEGPKWTDRKCSRHSPSPSEERVPHNTTSSGINAPTGTATPIPDNRKSDDSGSYDEVSRPPLDPPPAPPPMEALLHMPSPLPADPPVRRGPSPSQNRAEYESVFVEKQQSFQQKSSRSKCLDRLLNQYGLYLITFQCCCNVQCMRLCL
ncbi:hypothetical protein ANCCAN_09617 [Ancylostoma caninum]|uniref:Uncharacterized protein n=1 Tax=Ancylostoma caninum TaxID=29170 RepID=A0A368GJ32_ANCCA|nr:hypothetical protein ANCCAN_09617 [Ancylostoma caninum]